jgi:hypothetical protein
MSLVYVGTKVNAVKVEEKGDLERKRNILRRLRLRKGN